jgi:hypothetical protein
LEAEANKRRWRKDPVAWAEERLGLHLWSKQQEILRAVAENRRVSIQSCHEIGKSFIAAVTVCWWIDSNPPGEAFVVTSAPTAPQVKAILWREIGRLHAQAGLEGRVNQTDWLIRMAAGNEEVVAFGRKPDEYNPTAFQGIHARRVLYVFDEACGIPASLWEAADSLIANDLSKALAIGNPDIPISEFAENCKPGSGWKVIEVGAFDSPNFTGEPIPEMLRDVLVGRTYVEEKRRKWAPDWRWTEDGRRCVPPQGKAEHETNPLWQSKVLGKFPLLSEDGGLIPFPWVRAAQQRQLPDSGHNNLGVDVGAGGDSTTIAHRRGYRIRIIEENHNPDTMQNTGLVIELLRKTQATHANIDTVGIGKGMVDRGREQDFKFEPISVGEKADDKDRFLNRRAELWWGVRELFEKGEIDIDAEDDDLAAELVSLRFERQSNGKIKIESKKEAEARGVPSPNRAEALMLACAKARKKITKATWGRAA